MVKRFILPKRVVAEAEVGRVTAGFPSVDPLRRAISEAKGYKAEHQDALVKEAETNAFNAVMPDGERPRTCLDIQMGKPMTGHQVRALLLTLNPSLIFRENNELKRYLIRVKNPHPVDEHDGEISVCAMEQGIMPEFSTINVVEVKRYNKEAHALEKRLEINEKNPEIRGWRTVLARLIKAGYITESGADRLFGAPSKDSERWAYQLGHRGAI